MCIGNMLGIFVQGIYIWHITWEIKVIFFVSSADATAQFKGSLFLCVLVVIVVDTTS